MKEETKNLKTSTDFSLLVKQCNCIALSVKKIQKVKNHTF